MRLNFEKIAWVFIKVFFFYEFYNFIHITVMLTQNGKNQYVRNSAEKIILFSHRYLPIYIIHT